MGGVGCGFLFRNGEVAYLLSIKGNVFVFVCKKGVGPSFLYGDVPLPSFLFAKQDGALSYFVKGLVALAFL